MAGWFRRLLGGSPPPPRPPVPAAPAAGPPVLAPPAFGLRLPLVGRSGAVEGYELQWPPPVQQRVDRAPDSPAAAAHRLALLSAAGALARTGRAVLVAQPAAALERPAVAESVSAGTLLLLEDGWSYERGAPAAVPALQARGVVIGRPDGPAQAGGSWDFVALSAPAGALEPLLLSAQRWRELRPGLRLVARGLVHLEDVERALAAGIDQAGGALGTSAAPTPRRELGSAAHRICQLLSQLAQDSELQPIADAVRVDVALTYRLLRYANSPALGLSRAVETVEQAVQVLGRAELRRWLSMMLLNQAQARTAGRALQEAALARGRLLEMLARTSGDEDAGAHFTLGLLTVIEPLLQVPLAAAVAPLRLSAPVELALLRRQGPWADRLALLEALDAGAWARAEELAARAGWSGELPTLVDEAWAWAAQVSAGSE